MDNTSNNNNFVDESAMDFKFSVLLQAVDQSSPIKIKAVSRRYNQQHQMEYLFLKNNDHWCWDTANKFNQPFIKVFEESGIQEEHMKVIDCTVCHQECNLLNYRLAKCSRCGVSAHLPCIFSRLQHRFDNSCTDWVCECCRFQIVQTIPQLQIYNCAVCPNNQLAGPMIPVVSRMKDKSEQIKGWIHVVCARYIPELDVGVNSEATSVSQFEIKNISSPQDKVCEFCSTNTGALVKCRAPNCETYYHVTCANLNQCHLRKLFVGHDEMQHFTTCPQHNHYQPGWHQGQIQLIEVIASNVVIPTQATVAATPAIPAIAIYNDKEVEEEVEPELEDIEPVPFIQTPNHEYFRTQILRMANANLKRKRSHHNNNDNIDINSDSDNSDDVEDTNINNNNNNIKSSNSHQRISKKRRKNANVKFSPEQQVVFIDFNIPETGQGTKLIVYELFDDGDEEQAIAIDEEIVKDPLANLMHQLSLQKSGSRCPKPLVTIPKQLTVDLAISLHQEICALRKKTSRENLHLIAQEGEIFLYLQNYFHLDYKLGRRRHQSKVYQYIKSVCVDKQGLKHLRESEIEFVMLFTNLAQLNPAICSCNVSWSQWCTLFSTETWDVLQQVCQFSH
jgi:hypothetical protein